MNNRRIAGLIILAVAIGMIGYGLCCQRVEIPDGENALVFSGASLIREAIRQTLVLADDGVTLALKGKKSTEPECPT